MSLENDANDSALENADLASGFTGETVKKVDPPAEAVVIAETPREPPAPKPEYVRLTKSDWEEVKAAAAKTASYDAQLSKAFGTIGNLQKIVNGLQSAKTGGIKLTPEAFAEMEKDFPELAQQTRAALEKALSGVNGSSADAPDFKALASEIANAREVEALEDTHPDWRTIVGAVDITKEQPNAENPFRKWLATKDATYQARVNGTESAAVISRAINLFQAETKAPATPASRADPRADRIRSAVQPKGDGAAAAPTNTDEDEFAAGFRSR